MLCWIYADIFAFCPGNYGNLIDGAAAPTPTKKRVERGSDFPGHEGAVTTPLLEAHGSMSCKSTTRPEKPVFGDGNRFGPWLYILKEIWTNVMDFCTLLLFCLYRIYFHLPISARKPCIHVRCSWEDRAYRLHHSNMLDRIASKFVSQHTIVGTW